MTTIAKNYTKRKKKTTDGQNPRTNGKSKAIQTKSHKEAYTYTLTEREKEKYIHIFWEVWAFLPAFSRCSAAVVPHVDVFLIYLWWGSSSPHLTLLPPWQYLAVQPSVAAAVLMSCEPWREDERGVPVAGSGCQRGDGKDPSEEPRQDRKSVV